MGRAAGRVFLLTIAFVVVFVVFLAGSADRVDVLFNIAYTSQIWAYRVAVFVAPPLAGLIAYRACRELQQGDLVEQERTRAEREAHAAARQAP